MLESLIAIVIGVAIVLFFAKKRMLAFALWAIGFTSLAILQVIQNRPIGLIALVFTVVCIERMITLKRQNP